MSKIVEYVTQNQTPHKASFGCPSILVHDERFEVAADVADFFSLVHRGAPVSFAPAKYGGFWIRTTVKVPMVVSSVKVAEWLYGVAITIPDT